MTGPTGRPPAPRTADEKATLLGFLEFQRKTIEWKVSGLDDDQARWSPVPSGTSLLGIVRHLADVERRWLRRRFAGEEVGDRFRSRENPDGDFRPGPGATLADALAAYREEQRKGSAIVAEAGLDDVAALPVDGGAVSLRWILGHLVEETARHAGHADLIRELIDGSIGE